MRYGFSIDTARLGRKRCSRCVRAAPLFIAVLCICSKLAAADGQWIRPDASGNSLTWGRTDGLVFGLPSENGMPGPRGLIRVGIYLQEEARPQLVNYIAIEPVVSGPGSRFDRMAFSELEPSQLDAGQRGKRLTVRKTSAAKQPYEGELTQFTLPRSGTIERLCVPIDVERFSANGAHVFVKACMFSDHPDEVRFSVESYPDSPPIEELTLTATMGNFEKLRVLWLKERQVKSLELFAGYGGDNFVEHENYPLEEMLRLEGGEAIVLATSDEASPSEVFSATAARHWHYPLPRLTQYWKVNTADLEPDLRVRVNGRRVYWASHDPIPGGAAFENFEVRQRYKAGQAFVFGLTHKEPWQFQPPIPHLSKDTGIKGRPGETH